MIYFRFGLVRTHLSAQFLSYIRGVLTSPSDNGQIDQMIGLGDHEGRKRHGVFT